MKRLTEKLAEWVETTLLTEAMGEQIDWDVFPAQAQDGFHIAFILSIPSGMVGEALSAMATTPLAGAFIMGQPDVDNLIRQSLEQLRTERTKKLSEQMNGSHS